MTSDRNKNITNILYNHLKLPTQVNFGNGGVINYVYDAAGKRLERTSSSGVYTEYANGYVYEGGNLQFFNHPEGYVQPDGSGGYDYVYQYKDHLGNVRLSYTEDPSNPGQPTIIEENNYYPFGLKMKGFNSGGDSALGNDIAKQWKYNGIELEESLGLDLYEMPLRKYDPAIARWTSIDPVVHYDYSTYQAFDNNPVFWADSSGANSTAEWLEANGLTQDDLITIYQAPSNGNNAGGPGDPPKRGEGRNAPYIYSITIAHYPEDADGPTEVPYNYNPDVGYAHFNSLFYHESRIPNRFIAHYLYGNGAQYDLTIEEFKEIKVSRPNVINSKQFREAGIGVTEGEFIVPSVFANQDGTVGEASFLYKGTLQRNIDGTFNFSGTMELRDRYDFNWQDKERTWDNKLLTLWGATSMRSGTSFRIVGPQINITENNRGHSYFGPSGSGRSEINGGKE